MVVLATNHGDNGIFGLVPFFLFAGIAIIHLIWRSSRKQRVLEQWAARQKFKLIYCEERWMRTGPFFFTSGKGQAIYRITVRFPDGTTTSGWARCGSMFFGLLSDNVEVRWDKEKPQPPGFPVILREVPDQPPPS